MAVITKKLIACRDINIIAEKCNASQTAICTATFKINLGPVPVYVLLTFLFIEIDSEYTAMAFTLLTSPHNRGRN
jgi:hypothetical protein